MSVRPRAAESGAYAVAADDQLKRTGGDFLAGTGNANDNQLAQPRLFQCLTHHLGVAGAVEGVVGPADLVGAEPG